MSDRSIRTVYSCIIDDIDWMLDNDTTIKGVMNQRLQACRVWFANALRMEDYPNEPSINVSINKYECKGVEFKYNPNAKLPRWLPKDQLQSACVPVLEDYNVSGLIVYQGYDEQGGYFNYYLSGCCPIHKRVHDGQAWKWVLKVKKDKTWAGFKCWRDESFQKIQCIEQLLP